MFDSDYRHNVSPHLRAAMDRLSDPQAVWDIFRDDATIAEMKRLTALKRPAVEATSARLLALGGWAREKDARKTFGKLARCIMESVGYVVERGNVETPKDPLFTKGTRYRPRVPPATVAEMTTMLTIPKIGRELSAALAERAAYNGRSVEAEALEILTEAVAQRAQKPEPNLAEAIQRRFAALGGVDDLEPYPDVPAEPPPSFDS
jgi:plasmid stability protein